MSKCGAETEVYSRVVGYHRPVKNWNKGKREEFKDRKIFALPPSSSAGVLFLMTFLLITSAGCSTANSAIRSASGKNVSADGFLTYQSITTGATENSPTPSVHLVTGSLEYNSMLVSVPDGFHVPDAGNYRSKRSVSIWNSDSVSESRSFSFTASSAESAKAILEKLLELDASRGGGEQGALLGVSRASGSTGNAEE